MIDHLVDDPTRRQTAADEWVEKLCDLIRRWQPQCWGVESGQINKAELGGAPDSAFSAQLGSVTYYAVTRSYGHPAYIEVRGARRGLKRLDLGTYVKLEQAKHACERHYAAGCEL